MSLEEEMSNPDDKEVIRILHQRLKIAKEQWEMCGQEGTEIIAELQQDLKIANMALEIAIGVVMQKTFKSNNLYEVLAERDRLKDLYNQQAIKEVEGE